MRFVKRFLFILFFQTLFFLTLFYVQENYYTQWLVGFVVLFCILIFLAAIVIPSKKRMDMLNKVLEEYKTIVKLEQDLREETLKLDFTCPACETKNNYWSFLQEYKCSKCASELWSSKLKDSGDDYEKAFKKREKIRNFNNKYPYRIIKKVKKMILFEN